MHLALILLVVAVAGIAAWLHHQAEQKRAQELDRLAARLGLRFSAAPDSRHDDLHAHFEIFRRGFDRVARNTMQGQLAFGEVRLSVRAGDFRYKQQTGSGKNRRTTTFRFSYLIVHLPFPTPAVLVRPEGMFDKVAAAFGFDDIDFESAEFSRAFYVKSSDKRFAYALLEPRMMQFLLDRRPPMLDLEAGQLCLSDGRRRWEPDGFVAQIEFVRRLLAQWPRHLWAQLEEGTWTTRS